jgi:hypothetical protein
MPTSKRQNRESAGLGWRYRGRYEAPASHGRRRRNRMLVIVLIMLFLPAGLYAGGIRANRFENHRLASLPGASAGWAYLADLNDWATDNIPLRQQGVELSNDIDRHIFGDSSSSSGSGGGTTAIPGAPPSTNAGNSAYPLVLAGKNGYLFYGPDISLKCEPARQSDAIIGAVQTLAKAVEASGRTFVLEVAPDKSTILPADMPDSYFGKDCASARAAQMESAVARLPFAPDLAGDLRTAAAAGQQIYLPKDTHWDAPGAIAFTRSVIGALDPSVSDSFAPRQLRAVQRVGDLTTLQGSSQMVTVQQYSLHAPSIVPDWTTMGQITETPSTYLSSGPPGTQVPGRVLFLGDSFVDAEGSDLAYFFQSFTKLHYSAAGSDPAEVVQQIVDSDSVVLEMVERNFDSGNAQIFDPAFVAEVSAAVAANPR